MSSITVRSGDSMWAIAQRSGVTLQSLIEANPQVSNPNLIFAGQELELPGSRDDFQAPVEQAPVVAAPELPPPAAPPPTPMEGQYVVAAGDTLSAIAARSGVSLSALVQANPRIADPNLIYPGQVINVPGSAPAEEPPAAPVEQAPEPAPEAPATEGGVYVVRSGDTLSGIAARAGVSLADVLRANPGIRNPSLIYPGQQIQIPAGGDVPAPHAPIAPVGGGDPSSNPYYQEFVRAAEAAGVPAEWASNPALIQLVRHESGFRPDAKNPSSSAFGLFQFLDNTWSSYLPEVPYGTQDPYWQAVGGLRYVEQRYGTPERAWAFWQSTVNKDASIAPPDLRNLSQYWIDHSYGGY